MAKDLTFADGASRSMVRRAAEQKIELVWDRYEAMQPQCGFGTLGICCRNCSMGPCRIDPFGKGPQEGVCGANADTIVARNLIRMIAGGAAAHSDHGRDIVYLRHRNRDSREIAADVARAAQEEFGRQEGFLRMPHKAPEARQKLWGRLGR